MMSLIGETVRTRYMDSGFEYVERVFAVNPDKGSEIIGGNIRELIGQEKTFKTAGIRI